MSTLVLIGVFILVLAAYIWKRNRFPGPVRMPLVGSIPFTGSLKRGMSDWSLNENVTSHPLAMIQIAAMDMYVINDFNLAKDLFSRDEFSLRGANHFIKNHRLWGKDEGAGIIFNNGDGWSNQRRFSLRTLRDFGFGKQSMEGAMNIEIDEMIDRYSKEKGDVLISSDFNLPIINILWQMVANARLDNKKGQRMVELVNHLFTSPTLSHMMPAFIVKNFPNLTDFAIRCAVIKEHKQYLIETINEHIETFDDNHLRDFIDVYLSQVNKDSRAYSKNDLCSILLDFFHAGTETSSTTLKWFVHMMAMNEDCQTRCRNEINEVLGSNRPVMANMQDLDYLMAALCEVQRMSRTAPLSLPHNSAKDFNYNGHIIPKGSMFRVNISFIMNDPKYFPDPDKFDPTRFLDQTGKFVKNERIIPFGIGKRFCMGELLARNEIFLFAANLIQRLKFMPPDNHKLPNAAEYTINTSRIPTDFYVKIQSTDMNKE